MPRSNRPRRRAGGSGKNGGGPNGASGGNGGTEDDQPGLDRLMAGWRRVEHRRSGDWNVQPVSAASAVKDYLCPGCGLTVAQGTAHLVTWRADGVLGDASDLAARRHWHTHCWRIGA